MEAEVEAAAARGEAAAAAGQILQRSIANERQVSTNTAAARRGQELRYYRGEQFMVLDASI